MKHIKAIPFYYLLFLILIQLMELCILIMKFSASFCFQQSSYFPSHEECAIIF